MPDSQFEYLPAFARIPRGSISAEARMSCTFDEALSFAFLQGLIDKHWSEHLRLDPECDPVFCLHLAWQDSQNPGIVFVSVGDDALTAYNDPHYEALGVPEAKLSRAFLTDFLAQVFIDGDSDYALLLDRWHDLLSKWFGTSYVGQVGFFVPLRDPGMILVKDDEDWERVPAFVVTDASGSAHTLLKAQTRAAALPDGMTSWCVKEALRDDLVALFLE
jgi:hypothetical protein